MNRIGPTAITEYFRKSGFPKPSHYNQSVVLKSDRRLNPYTLKMSFRQLCAYHDVLRSCWDGNQLTVRDLNCLNLVGFEEHDCRQMDAENSGAFVDQVAERLETTIDLKAGPLVKVAHFHLRESDKVFVVIHHLSVDGVSWRIIVEDLNDIYSQLAGGTTMLSLPKVRCTFARYAQAVQEYSSSTQIVEELPYWTDVACKVGNGYASDCAKMGSVPFRLDSDATRRLLSLPASYGVGANDLLTAAVANAWHTVTGQETLSLSMEGHGREPFGTYNLPLDRVVGWFTTLYPVVLPTVADSFDDLVQATANVMRHIPNHGFGYGTLLHISGHEELACTPMMTFNYLGSIQEPYNENTLLKQDPSRPKCPDISPLNRDREPLCINCMVTDGCFEGVLDYNESVLPQEEAKRFIDVLMDCLNQYH